MPLGVCCCSAGRNESRARLIDDRREVLGVAAASLEETELAEARRDSNIFWALLASEATACAANEEGILIWFRVG